MSPRLGLGRSGSSVSATLSQRNLWDSLGRRLGVWGSRDRAWPREKFASWQLVEDIYSHEPTNGPRRWCREEVQSLSPRMPRFRGQEEEEAPGKGAEGVASGWPGPPLPSLLHQLDGGPKTEEEERACQRAGQERRAHLLGWQESGAHLLSSHQTKLQASWGAQQKEGAP